MSWMKKRNPTNSTQPQVPMYNPNQHSNQEWQHDNNWYNQAPQQDAKPNYWQQPNHPQNYPQQSNHPHNYPQQNSSYQQPTYGNVQFTQQFNTQNNSGAAESDGWASNWGWADEDNSNVQAASNLTDSFANDESWSWGASDDPKLAPTEPLVTKRNKLETPQWSVESQVSQESSDDILQTSESDKSRMLSRSSTISHSPVLGQDGGPSGASVVVEEPGQVQGFVNKEILEQGMEAPPVEEKSKRPLKFKGKNFHSQSVNLETLPDNSEQPDGIVSPPRKIASSISHSFPDNNEAPINDRNQYLETAQLSDNYHYTSETTQQDDTLAPPPGLRRMVPGQTITAPEPLEGLRRMIPGESSSPEAAIRQQAVEIVEPEQQREATIGADSNSIVQAVRRRGSVEGQIQDEDVTGLTAAVRSLNVGEKEESGNGRESSGSERGKSPRYRDKDAPRDRDRDRGRGRYSPDNYRDNKQYDRRRYKDRRYEEDTDYYSDKERERRHRDEREYDKKYSSLRKDKEKDRRRRDYDRRHDYYYGRYEQEYDNEGRSRASSRSDSVHENYRDRDRGHERDRRDRKVKEKDRHRRPREPFNPYMQQGFGYDMYTQYYQQYHYYENLRKTNPQAYAQLYRKYYQDNASELPYGTEDRASVHSGRSSANEELTKDRYTRQSYYSHTSLPHIGGYYRGSQTHSVSGQYGLDEPSFTRTLDQTDTSINYDDSQLSVQRMTPAKFSTAHIKGVISSGQLVKILPHYPLDGQNATVEICNLESLLFADGDYQELKRFPGPLIKGVTNKKTIIEYCENKIKGASSNLEICDKESYVLMWELLILLIRQNGMVVGADIAELLLKDRSQAVTQRPSSAISSNSSNNLLDTSPESNEFPNHSTTTLKEEEITNRFREYLLYGSGKEALEWAMKHGLWGHALFLASKLDKRTYANVMMRFANGLTMNDPLQTLYQLLSGRTPAAVTCVADEKWGDWRPHLAMILSNSTQRPELNCKSISALGDTLMGRDSLFAAQFCYLMAEVAFGEYGSGDAKLVLLGTNHNAPFLQFATNEAIHMTEIYEYARSLNDDDFGLVHFQHFKYILAMRLADVGLLETALAYLEKVANFIVQNPNIIELNLVDRVALLADRLKYYDPLGDGEIEVDLDSSRVENSWLKDLRRVQNDLNIGIIPQQQTEQPQEQNQETWQQWSTEQTEQLVTDQQQQHPQQGNPYQDHQQYWPGQQWTPEVAPGTYQPETDTQQNYYGVGAQIEDIQQPQISLPNQRQEQEEKLPPESVKNDTEMKAKVSETAPQDKSGWFGGIFSKLSLKPKNQMKLPDDKNPTILWDSEKKRWVNTDNDNSEDYNNFKPPPKLLPASKPQEVVQENGAPNMFKLQRNRNLKKSYIDVFNPNATATQSLPPQSQPMGVTAPMNFFVPQPINDPNAPTNFLTVATPVVYNESSQQMKQQ